MSLKTTSALNKSPTNYIEDDKMPEISRFLGIVILMYANEHNPPHLHVRYNDFAAVIDLRTLEVRDGKLPPRVLGLVVEWVELHQAELLDIWDTKVFKKIDPLV